MGRPGVEAMVGLARVGELGGRVVGRLNLWIWLAMNVSRLGLRVVTIVAVVELFFGYVITQGCGGRVW